jgi:PIN domain nuclease of toxin-antitoxin system
VAETYVVDTHALLWHMTSDRRLSAAAAEAIDGRLDGTAVVVVSVVSLAELYYAIRKLHLAMDFRVEVEGLVADGFDLAPVETKDVFLFPQLETVPEMHDRLIAALAIGRGAKLVTPDRALARVAGVTTVW